MRARLAVRAVVVLVGAVLGAAVLSACSGTGVTATRLDHAVGPAFARLYVVAQHRLGRSVARRPDGFARCRRSNVTSRSSGAGDDWTCLVNFPFADGHIQPITYDLQVQPDGCYTADGPTQIVGPQHQRTDGGATVTNALFAFDGCFDVT